jgi:hypothetical protein
MKRAAAYPGVAITNSTWVARLYAVGLVALLLALPACGTVSGTATYTRDTRTITAESGERFTIKLNASPGIGDDWRIVGGPERARVRLVDESYQTGDRGVPGGSGTASFLSRRLSPARPS